MIDSIRRGQIYSAALAGLKDAKRVLVVSSDQMNSHPLWDKVVVVYVTTKGEAVDPWIELPSQKGRSLANCTEVLTLPKSALKKPVDPPVTYDELREVYRGIAVAFGAEPVYRELYG